MTPPDVPDGLRFAPALTGAGRTDGIHPDVKQSTMSGVISLDDVQSTDSGTSSSDSGSDSSADEYGDLEEAVESVGGDFEHAKLYVEQTNNEPEVLIEFAEGLNDGLMQLHETYRQSSDRKRIDMNWLRNDDERDYGKWRGAFYGDSDGSDDGTHNAIAQEVRDHENGNLFWYRAIFPEPQTEFWDSDAVLWYEFDSIGYEDGDQDSHIYVTRDFAEQYSDFTIEVDGEARPRPPANSEMDQLGDSSSDSSDLMLDPRDFTVEELRDELQAELHEGWSSTAFEEVLEAEKAGKDRTTAKKAIRGAMNEAASQESDSSQTDLSDFDAEKVEKLVDKGFTRDEVVEILG